MSRSRDSTRPAVGVHDDEGPSSTVMTVVSPTPLADAMAEHGLTSQVLVAGAVGCTEQRERCPGDGDPRSQKDVSAG